MAHSRCVNTHSHAFVWKNCQGSHHDCFCLFILVPCDNDNLNLSTWQRNTKHDCSRKTKAIILANKIWCHNSRISNLEETQKFGQKRRQLLRITSWMLLSRVVVCTWCMPDASCILQPVWLLLLISYHHICCHGTHATPCHVFFSSCILQYIQRHANVCFSICSFSVAPPKKKVNIQSHASVWTMSR